MTLCGANMSVNILKTFLWSLAPRTTSWQQIGIRKHNLLQ